MITTHPPRPAHEPAINVVVLFGSASTPTDELECSVATWSSRGAVLVVFAHPVDAITIERLEYAGADLCVIAPTPTELFSNVEQARTRHRRASCMRAARANVAHDSRRRDDDRLDALWIRRSDRQSQRRVRAPLANEPRNRTT